jgi:DNA-binding CsgD family transcriptional regulator
MAPEIAGRDEELAAVRAFVGGNDNGFAALVLEGDAGIGKSTLWLAGVEAARERGLRVLASRPAEAERSLAFAALGDLFEDVLDEVLPALTPPRRRALEAALLVADDAGHDADPRALAVAVRNALQSLSRDARVVVAVDDVQWLDPSTADVLAFALRRLETEDVLLLVARRRGEAGTTLESALGPTRVERLPVGPLSLGATHLLLRQRLGRAFSRPTLVRLHEVSGGNPFYALELARATLVLKQHKLGAAAARSVVVPESLGQLVQEHLADLPPATREALAVVAAHGRPSVELLRAAGVGEEVLEPARAAGVVDALGDAIRFTHPLLASTLYQGLTAEARRRVHSTLADLSDDPVERARHLALSSDAPDPGVASALEQAGALALTRGAPIGAAELYESASRLTPADAGGDIHRRELAAAEALLLAGDAKRAEALAYARLAATEAGLARAEVLRLLSRIAIDSGDIERSIALAREALVEAEADPAVQSRVHQFLGLAVRFTESLASARRHAVAALELAESLGGGDLRAGALATLALVQFNGGEPGALALAEEADELGAGIADPELRLDVRFTLAHILVWSCELDRARTVLEAIHAECSTWRETPGAEALWYLALVELRAGRWSLAAEYAEHVREIGLQYSAGGSEAPQPVWIVGLVSANRGDVERGRELAELGLALAATRPALRVQQNALLGAIELWEDDARAAAERFADAEASALESEIGEPMMYGWRDDEIEALLQLGRADEAEALLDAWEADAKRLDRRWVLALATRCRGLVAAARGDNEVAAALLQEAVAEHEAVGDPLGRGRALLALGIVRRRLRQRRDAREALEAALATFEELGAAHRAERTRRELGRIGGRTRADGLTPAERRVAELVAKGSTNREVAATLFLAERTVEAHLSHVYAKLGVRSRTELARVLS